MEVAIIPPYSELHLLKGRKFQMMLPECRNNPDYRFFFEPNTRSRDMFVIMDNGMFEGKMRSLTEMIAMIDRWEPNEFVMPDSRDDPSKTLYNISLFLEEFVLTRYAITTDVMAVIQVTDIDQVPRFMKQIAFLQDMFYKGQKQFTIGIPRRLVETWMSRTARVDIANIVRQCGYSNPIHLLGYARTGVLPSTFNEVAALRDEVRSIDTDAPFVWAMRSYTLGAARCRLQRPGGYFHTRLEPAEHHIAMYNIQTIDGWAQGHE